MLIDDGLVRETFNSMPEPETMPTHATIEIWYCRNRAHYQDSFSVAFILPTGEFRVAALFEMCEKGR